MMNRRSSRIPDPGDRVRLVYMPDDPDPLEEGTEGLVLSVNSYQINMKWDNGRRLALVPGVDIWEIIS